MPEDELLDALRGLGADHEPDVAAIRRRMDEGRPTVVPLRRRVEPGPRRRPVLLSAAAAILIGGGVTVAASQMGPANDTTPANELPNLVPSISTPSRSTTAPSPSATETGRPDEPTPDGVATSKDGQSKNKDEDKTKDAEPSSDPTRTESSQPPSSGAGPAAGVAAASTVTKLVGGQEISLGAADEDWLAIGTRNDMKTVRKKASARSPLLNFDAPDSAASVDGPFKLSFQGGIPEQDRQGSTRWMQTNGAVVTVTASSAARTVTLYTGNAMNIVVKGGGLKDHKVTLDDQEPGYVTRLVIPSHAGETTIELQSGRGPVHLVAATASSS